MALPIDQRVPHVLDNKGFARPMTEREIKLASGKLRINEEGKEYEVEFGPKFNEHPLYKKYQEYYEGAESDKEVREILD